MFTYPNLILRGLNLFLCLMVYGVGNEAGGNDAGGNDAGGNDAGGNKADRAGDGDGWAEDGDGDFLPVSDLVMFRINKAAPIDMKHKKITIPTITYILSELLLLLLVIINL